MYENYKGNKDYDLNLNNEIAKVEQLEIEIGKSMMSLVFWEMWNENHGEIDEKVWVNQKTKKIKDEIRVCDSYLIEAKNTMPRETKSHKTKINLYLIRAMRFPWSSSSMRFHDCRALWDFYEFYAFSISGFQRESEQVLCYLFKFCCGLFSRAENFVIFYQGLWAEKM